MGFFSGDQTDKAVKEFQDYAIKLVRMKRSVGKRKIRRRPLTSQSTRRHRRGRKDPGMNLNNGLARLDSSLFQRSGTAMRRYRRLNNGQRQEGTDDHHQGTPVVEGANRI